MCHSHPVTVVCVLGLLAANSAYTNCGQFARNRSSECTIQKYRLQPLVHIWDQCMCWPIKTWSLWLLHLPHCRDREHVREGAVHPQDPAGGPEGDAGGDALPVCLPQPVSVHLHKSLSVNDDRPFLCCSHR